MIGFPRPVEETLFERKEKVDGTCPKCGAKDLSKYRVMSEGGWWTVVKCQTCLDSLVRERDKNQYAPCSLLWELM